MSETPMQQTHDEKQMDVVLDDPYTIRAADANSKIENITNEVIRVTRKR